ncbi:hypothetical protein M408DRAFT_327164 [Serendipita vermifera MAFF 305830]|uniref:VASt domain-containing protein n=1 Tax=Serendipita vermifera MAFF 305830 TaxID=933852 RepID=A0A0C3B4F0_SERVB|nr:hypothetical protein M408DRAFT_327164 [Serendipita vermifera MAFF 305830]
MSGWLNKLTTKDGKLAPATPNGKTQKSGSRSVTPSPSLPKIALPPTDSPMPKVVLSQDSDSVSPMTVSAPSVHRIDSMSPSVDEQGSLNDAANHRRYYTIANDDIPARTRHISDVGSPPKASRSRSGSVADNGPAIAPGLTDSPTQSMGSRGSIGSGESVPYQSLSQLVDSPPQIGRSRVLSVGAASEQGREPEGQGSPEKKRRTGRQHASSIGAAAASSSPFGRKAPPRHQTTMGMGLASALAASGMGIAPPPSMLVSPTGGLAPPSLQKKPSNLSSSNLTTNGRVSPERTRVIRSGPRSESNTSRQANGNSDSDDSDEYDSGDALSFNDDEIPITGFAVATMKRNQEFHELFPTVPQDDYLIDDYGCALQRDILIQGRLYVSENHICFHANIFGWVTDLVIPVTGISVVEKKMTAFVIPNAIGITDQGTKYTFASFLARDTAYDVIYSVWRNGGPLRSASPGSEGTPGVEGGLAAPMLAGGSGGTNVRKATQCACSKAGAHYPNTAMDVVVPGTPEQIYNLMFASGFIKDFLAKDQRLMDIQTSDWQPSPENNNLLSRHMSYIKPLSGGFGPKQTKCELRDENQHIDFNEYASTITTTRTPDVPSGSVFAVKTRTCVMWAGSTTTKVIVTFTVEWTGKSFVKGIIERSCTDGQKTYYSELEAAMRKYITDHRTEFLPEGVDAAAADQEAEEAANQPAKEVAPLQPTGEKPVAASRGLQWALDTFEAATKVATDSISGLFDIVSDMVGGLTFSKTTVLGFVIAFLVASNIYTILTAGQRREKGRQQVVERRETERERWVGDAVRAFMEVQQSLQAVAPTTAPTTQQQPSLPPQVTDSGHPVINAKAELEELRTVMTDLEERLAKIKSRLEQLD